MKRRQPCSLMVQEEREIGASERKGRRWAPMDIASELLLREIDRKERDGHDIEPNAPNKANIMELMTGCPSRSLRERACGFSALVLFFSLSPPLS